MWYIVKISPDNLWVDKLRDTTLRWGSHRSAVFDALWTYRYDPLIMNLIKYHYNLSLIRDIVVNCKSNRTRPIWLQILDSKTPKRLDFLIGTDFSRTRAVIKELSDLIWTWQRRSILVVKSTSSNTSLILWEIRRADYGKNGTRPEISFSKRNKNIQVSRLRHLYFTVLCR